MVWARTIVDRFMITEDYFLTTSYVSFDMDGVCYVFITVVAYPFCGCYCLGAYLLLTGGLPNKKLSMSLSNASLFLLASRARLI